MSDKNKYQTLKFQSPLGPSMSHPSNTFLPPAEKPFFSTLKEGIAFGAGSSIGSKIISSVFGSSSVQIKSSGTSGKCEDLQTTFDLCCEESLRIKGNFSNLAKGEVGNNTCIQEKKSIYECEESLNNLNKCLSSSSEVHRV